MNFFKSVFSDDPNPSNPEYVSGKSGNASRIHDEDDPDHRHSSLNDDPSDPNPNPDSDEGSAISGGGWNFGGFIQTLTSKSESVIETYRRDLREFGSGLRKELEIAQESLETAGHAVDELRSSVLKETAQMISQGKDAIFAGDIGFDSDNSSSSQNMSSSRMSLSSKRYNRFDAQVHLIQTDVGTYSLEPEDLNDYSKWMCEFSLDEKKDEIKGFLDGNDAMSNIYTELVPKNINSETFWSRYYYKVFKLKQAEDLRAKLVSTISKEEEQLSWDVDDDDGDDNAGSQSCSVEKVDNAEGGFILDKSHNLSENRVSENDSRITLNNENLVKESKDSTSIIDEKSEKMHNADAGRKEGIAESTDKEGSILNSDTELSNNGAKSEAEDKVTVETKDELGGSKTEDRDSSKTSSQPLTQEEEDLGWDEIEDLSSIDEIKPSQRKSPHKADLQKRLRAAEEVDLSWDVEDDDERAKSLTRI